MHRRVPLDCIVAFALLCAAIGTRAQDLAIALATPLRTLDPHERNAAGHNSVIDHVFERLVNFDAREALRPALAESWKTLDARTWEFKLRKGVLWHDGSPFSADDVIASLNRASARPDAATSFGVFTRRIESVGRVDAHTLRIRTQHPHPLLPNDLAAIRIVLANAATATPGSEVAASLLRIGTGPFRLKEFIPGERVALERHDAYWGTKPVWAAVKLRFVPNSQARVFALLADEVQLIEEASAADLVRLANETRVHPVSAVTNRLIYLHLDSQRETSPFVTAKNGKPLPRNPLKDARVRRALSLAIDRPALVERLFAGRAEPAAQLLPRSHAGTSPRLAAPPLDRTQSLRLLAEAGYPEGFALTLHTPTNRYAQDVQTAYAVAGMLARVGVKVRVDALPAEIFFKRLAGLEFSFYLAGWGTQTGEASSPLRALIGSFDARSGMGQANRGRFSDSGVDAMIRKAMVTLDETQRNTLLASATDQAIGDQQALIPLHHEMSTWVLRKGLSYSGRSDQATYAFDLRNTLP